MISRQKTQKKWVLLNPGPVNVSERVRKALLRPDICHREEEFGVLLSSVRTKLLKIFSVEKTHSAAFFSGSGTTALEAMLSSFAGDKKKILVLSNGVYGERISHILGIHKVAQRILSTGYETFPSQEEIENILKKDKSIHAIAMVHHETSTGRLNPLKLVGAIAKKYKKLFIVDAISSLGAETINIKQSSIDYLCGTSGKCLHGFPGVSFVLISKKEALKLGRNKPTSAYLDLANTLKLEEQNDTPFTPAVQIFYAFDEALDELKTEGLSKRITSYAKKSSLLEKGLESLGIRFVIEKENRSHVLAALWTPEKISYEKLHDRLKEKGFVIYAGQSKLKGKIFRVANLGNVSEKDLSRFLSELKRILKK